MPEKPIIQPGTRSATRSDIIALCGLVPNIIPLIGNPPRPANREIVKVVESEVENRKDDEQ